MANAAVPNAPMNLPLTREASMRTGNWLFGIAGVLCLASAATAQAPSYAVKHVWCSGRISSDTGSQMFHSKIGAITNFNSHNVEEAFRKKLVSLAIKGAIVTCYWHPTSAQIQDQRNWALNAKSHQPISWREIDWVPR